MPPSFLGDPASPPTAAALLLLLLPGTSTVPAPHAAAAPSGGGAGSGASPGLSLVVTPLEVVMLQSASKIRPPVAVAVLGEVEDDGASPATPAAAVVPVKVS